LEQILENCWNLTSVRRKKSFNDTPSADEEKTNKNK